MNFCRINFFLIYLLLSGSGWGQSENNSPPSSKGAVIVVSVKDPVLFIDPSGIPSLEKIEVGSILFEGSSAESGKNGSLTLLLSNGTLVTMEPETKMKIGLFEQVPFDSGDRKVSDLEGEPSNSKVEIDLDFGALVVKTKKLKSDSSFVIKSPVGTAGVHGTEFQMSQAPGAGVQLDVTESTVAFSPPGGQAVPVSQGQGIDVSSTGAVSTRPVNPVVAQNISAKNESASQASGEVSLGSVSEAMTEATAAEPAGDSSPFDSAPEIPEDSSDSMTEETALTEQPAPVEEPMTEEPASAQESSEESGDSSEPAESSSAESDSGESASNPESEPVSLESEPASEPVAETGSTTSSVADLEVPAADTSTAKVDDVLEQSPDAKETRKTGKTSAFAQRLSELSLDAVQMENFYALSDSAQILILEMETPIIGRLLGLVAFGPLSADNLFSYSMETRGLILQLEDSQMLALLEQGIDESLLLASLNASGISASKSGNLPGDPILSEIQQKVLLLGDELRASGNTEVFEEIQKLNGGVWTEEWIRVAQVGNLVSKKYDFLKDWSTLQSLPGTEVLSNPFYSEVSTLYDSLALDQLDGGPDPVVVGGSVISLGSESYNIDSLLGDKSTLLLGATETLSLNGRIIFNSTNTISPRVLALSGGAIEVGANTSVRSVLGDLVVSARQDVLLQGATLESAREVAVRSLRDLRLSQVILSADSSVRLKAARDLEVDGLQVSQTLPSLIMEATTIRLRNLDFPSATSVQLNSLKGPINGKYPNFGTAIPASDQIGRVNFIENVSSGGNPLFDRPSFDQFGGNISIGKLPQP